MGNLFGLSTYIHRPRSSEAWPSVSFTTIRTWDVYCSWSDLEPSRGVYNWTNLDWLVGLAQQHSVDIVYTFGRTPAWAGNGNSNSPPTLIADWNNFVTALVTRYAGKIKYYEMWNEANLNLYWSGTVTQLVTLETSAIPIIRAIDAAALILTPSSTAGATNVGNWLNSYFTAGGGASSDIIAFHGYPLNATMANSNPQPEYILQIISAVKTQASSHGHGSLPIWDTEGGWGSGTITDYNVQAAYLARHYILHLTSGIARYIWYSWDSTSWGTLWNATAGVLPPGKAYQVIQSWLNGATGVSTASVDGAGTYTVTLTLPNGSAGLIKWNVNGPLTVTVANTYTAQQDIFGNSSAVSGSASIGKIPILFSGAPVVGSGGTGTGGSTGGTGGSTGGNVGGSVGGSGGSTSGTGSTGQPLAPSRQIFIVNGLSNGTAGYYDGGMITWTSGLNIGLKMEVKSFDPVTNILTLYLAMPYDVQIGDTLTITPGCDKLITTCFNKFNNVVNFRGEPFVPGVDSLLNYPNADGSVTTA